MVDELCSRLTGYERVAMTSPVRIDMTCDIQTAVYLTSAGFLVCRGDRRFQSLPVDAVAIRAVYFPDDISPSYKRQRAPHRFIGSDAFIRHYGVVVRFAIRRCCGCLGKKNAKHFDFFDCAMDI